MAKRVFDGHWMCTFNSAFKDIENCTHTLNGEPESNTEFPQNLTN